MERELGQLLVLALILAALALLRRVKPKMEQAIAIIVAALAGHVAWHWMIERGDAFAAVAPDGWRDPVLVGGIALLALGGGSMLFVGWRRRRALRVETDGGVPAQ